MAYIENTNEIQWGVPTAQWQVIGKVGLYTAQNGGSALLTRDVTQQLAAAQDGADVDIPAEMFQIEMDVSTAAEISEAFARRCLLGGVVGTLYVGFLTAAGVELTNALSPGYARVAITGPAGWTDADGSP